MGLAVVASNTGKSSAVENSHNFSITVPNTGNGMALILGAISSTNDGPMHIDNCLFDGAPMSLLDLTSFGYVSAYSRFGLYLMNPGAGNKTVYMVFAGKSPINYGCRIDAVVYIISGVNQTTPFGTIKKGSDVETLTGITCGIDNLIIDLLATQQDTTPGSPGVGQTSYLADAIVGSSSWGNVASSAKQAGSESESVSWGSGAGVHEEYMAIPIIPSDIQFPAFLLGDEL